MIPYFKNFNGVFDLAKEYFRNYGEIVRAEKWQAVKAPAPMFEVRDFIFKCKMVEDYKNQIKPDLPWTDIHFEERVSREPLNPGESYKVWPYYKDDEKWKTQKDKFSHTYMERFWPDKNIKGIRFNYGNLDDVVNLLLEEPYTRQAILPIFFPEDTGSVHKERVPCTISYHFIHRGNQIDISYHIRSCDYIRHFKNDIYLTIKLTEWVLKELREKDDYWKRIELGDITMFINSLHVFEPEKSIVLRK